MKDRAFSVWSAAVDLVALGVLTLILCIPVVTICPAVTALYYSVAKSVRRGRGGPYREYFRSFRENLLQGIALSVILALSFGCPVLSRFRFKTAQILLFSLRVGARFPLRTLGLLALWAALGALCWFFPPALLIAPGAGTLISTFLLDPAFRHYMPERSEFDEGTDTWYLE